MFESDFHSDSYPLADDFKSKTIRFFTIISINCDGSIGKCISINSELEIYLHKTFDKHYQKREHTYNKGLHTKINVCKGQTIRPQAMTWNYICTRASFSRGGHLKSKSVQVRICIERCGLFKNVLNYLGAQIIKAWKFVDANKVQPKSTIFVS